jgi:hypothetical protein
MRIPSVTDLSLPRGAPLGLLAALGAVLLSLFGLDVLDALAALVSQGLRLTAGRRRSRTARRCASTAPRAWRTAWPRRSSRCPTVRPGCDRTGPRHAGP